MIHSPTPESLKILSPAKINLFLHITGKRPNGYHTIISLMSCVGLYDTLLLTFDTDRILVSCSNATIPVDKTNLAYQAAELFLKTAGIKSGVSILIEKKIPVSAGLGGGSSNAAAVLLGLNRRFGGPFTLDQLLSMGLTIGADVPFFVFGKPAVATGIGETLSPYNHLESLKVLLVYPGFGISTADMYKNINLGLTKCEKKIRLFSFENKDFDIKRHLCNDLESVAIAKFPEIRAIKEALVKNGACRALMSGSGSTVFGLFFNSAAALAAQQSLSKRADWRLFLVDLLV